VPQNGTRREKIATMTQEVARVFEAGIAAHPQDWHMLQRVFTADLDLARLAAAEAREQAAGAAGTGGEPRAAKAAGAGGEPRAAEPGATGRDRAVLNGQIDGAALDGLAGGAEAGEGGGEP
jgi:KDO2-lipid IV(A) lauroyltransferase